jgi:hypothetical protein
VNGLGWLAFLSAVGLVIGWLVRRDQRRHDERMWGDPTRLHVYCRCGAQRLGAGLRAVHMQGVRHAADECLPTGWRG